MARLPRRASAVVIALAVGAAPAVLARTFGAEPVAVSAGTHAPSGSPAHLSDGQQHVLGPPSLVGTDPYNWQTDPNALVIKYNDVNGVKTPASTTGCVYGNMQGYVKNLTFSHNTNAGNGGGGQYGTMNQLVHGNNGAGSNVFLDQASTLHTIAVAVGGKSFTLTAVAPCT